MNVFQEAIWGWLNKKGLMIDYDKKIGLAIVFGKEKTLVIEKTDAIVNIVATAIIKHIHEDRGIETWGEIEGELAGDSTLEIKLPIIRRKNRFLWWICGFRRDKYSFDKSLFGSEQNLKKSIKDKLLVYANH